MRGSFRGGIAVAWKGWRSTLVVMAVAAGILGHLWFTDHHPPADGDEVAHAVGHFIPLHDELASTAAAAASGDQADDWLAHHGLIAATLAVVLAGCAVMLGWPARAVASDRHLGWNLPAPRCRHLPDYAPIGAVHLLSGVVLRV